MEDFDSVDTMLAELLFKLCQQRDKVDARILAFEFARDNPQLGKPAPGTNCPTCSRKVPKSRAKA